MAGSAERQHDEDFGKGAVEGDEKAGNSSLTGQLGHRDQNPLVKSSDTDFPEPGESPEHTGEPQGKSLLDKDSGCGEGRAQQKPCPENPEHVGQNQDPGHRQKQNQGDEKDDPLVA